MIAEAACAYDGMDMGSDLHCPWYQHAANDVRSDKPHRVGVDDGVETGLGDERGAPKGPIRIRCGGEGDNGEEASEHN